MSEVKPKKTTKKTTPKTKVILKEQKKVRVRKPNYMAEYDKEGYLNNIERALNLWSILETINMKEELKTYVYTKLEECIQDKIVNPHDPWYDKLEVVINQEEETKEE